MQSFWLKALLLNLCMAIFSISRVYGRDKVARKINSSSRWRCSRGENKEKYSMSMPSKAEYCWGGTQGLAEAGEIGEHFCPGGLTQPGSTAALLFFFLLFFIICDGLWGRWCVFSLLHKTTEPKNFWQRENSSVTRWGSVREGRKGELCEIIGWGHLHGQEES